MRGLPCPTPSSVLKASPSTLTRRSPNGCGSLKYRFRTRPYKHQRKALVRFFRQRHLGVLWEPGLGKSKFVVDASCAGYQLGKINRVLIVCPLSVVGVWEDEYESHAPIPYDLQLFDKKDTVLPDFEEVLKVLVVNYDLSWRRKKLIKRFKPDFVVADESQKIKKASTRRSWYMRSWRNAPYRAILTGTPNPKGFIDLYGQWVFLNWRRFGTRIDDFEERYVIRGGYKGYVIRGYRNVKELKRKVKLDASVRRKDQTLDLPERVYQRLPIVLEDNARRLYDRLEEDFLAYLDSGEEIEIKIALVKAGKLQQVTGGFVNTSEGWRQVSSAKLDALEDRFEEVYAMEDKIVVVARYLAEIEAIAALSKRMKFETHVIKGGMKREDRDDERKEFQSTKRPSVMVIQIQTGGLGVTLHAANQAVFYSTTFALDDYIQACDRIHRIGQERKVTYRHLVARNTVDLDIYRSLREKKALMDVIMGKPRH